MSEYHKIETLYNRDEKTRQVIPGQLRCPEFAAVKRWTVTEKIDGTNIRVFWQGGRVDFGGRTDRAQLPPDLLRHLQATFTPERMAATLTGDCILYGEGYGNRIQKIGGLYRADVSFRLFDVRAGDWWLEPDAVGGIAASLGILTAPDLGPIDHLPECAEHLDEIIGERGNSPTAQQDGGEGLKSEGIIARAEFGLKTRNGHRLIWKLKYRDFLGGR
jgi:hypothetical protein